MSGVKPSQFSAATVAAMKTKLGVMTQAEADSRYPQITDGDATPIYTAEEVDNLLTAKANTGTSFVLRYFHTASFAPADGLTYYFGAFPVKAVDQNATYHQDVIPVSCKLVAATTVVTSGGSCTQEPVTIYLRKNNAADYLINNAVTFGLANALPYQFTAVDLNSTYAKDDKIEFKIVCPTWVTNPAAVYFQIDLYFIKL